MYFKYVIFESLITGFNVAGHPTVKNKPNVVLFEYVFCKLFYMNHTLVIKRPANICIRIFRYSASFVHIKCTSNMAARFCTQFSDVNSPHVGL